MKTTFVIWKDKAEWRPKSCTSIGRSQYNNIYTESTGVLINTQPTSQPQICSQRLSAIYFELRPSVPILLVSWYLSCQYQEMKAELLICCLIFILSYQTQISRKLKKWPCCSNTFRGDTWPSFIYHPIFQYNFTFFRKASSFFPLYKFIIHHPVYWEILYSESVVSPITLANSPCCFRANTWLIHLSASPFFLTLHITELLSVHWVSASSNYKQEINGKNVPPSHQNDQDEFNGNPWHSFENDELI